MSVRKRTWTSKGVEKSAWVVDYTDGQGKRRLKTFAKKKEADAFAATASVEVRQGVHVADRASVTVAAAAALWLESAKTNGLERSTIAAYNSHVEFHIAPLIGQTLLSHTNRVPAVRDFEDKLREGGRSAAMVKRVIGSLGSIISDAQERGLAVHNAVREMRGRRKGRERRLEKRHKGKLKVGVDIPTPQEVKAIVGLLSGRARPLLLTAIFSGLRSSELRGLTWSDVDLDNRVLHVRQRADQYNAIGKPKSEAGERAVPLPPIVVNTLREWRLACPRKDTGKKDPEGNPVKILELVFPNGAGNVESHGNIINRALLPAMIAAGVTVDTGDVDEDGKPVLAAKYTGLHALRHFYASWCINAVSQGGMGLAPKAVQERLGHSSITMTMDVYGHLFPRGDDAAELAAAEAALLGAV